jgi:hypothetical protein
MIETTTVIQTSVATPSSQSVSIEATGGPMLVAIGQPFIVPMADDILVEMVFTNVSTADQFSGDNADDGYIFVIVEFKVKNLGNRETHTFPSYDYDPTWELKVDKGYIYEASCGVPDCYSIFLRPEEVKYGVIAFQILASTKPVEMYVYEPYPKTPRITLRL